MKRIYLFEDMYALMAEFVDHFKYSQYNDHY